MVSQTTVDKAAKLAALCLMVAGLSLCAQARIPEDALVDDVPIAIETPMAPKTNELGKELAVDTTTTQGYHIQFPYHPMLPRNLLNEKAHEMVREEIEEMLNYILQKGLEYIDDKRKFGLITWGKVGFKIGQIIRQHQKLQSAQGVEVPLGKAYCRSAVQAIESSMNKSSKERDVLRAAKAVLTLDDLRVGLTNMVEALKESFKTSDMYCFIDLANGKIDGQNFDDAVGKLMGRFEYLEHASILPIVRKVIGLTVNLCQDPKKPRVVA